MQLELISPPQNESAILKVLSLPMFVVYPLRTAHSRFWETNYLEIELIGPLPKKRESGSKKVKALPMFSQKSVLGKVWSSSGEEAFLLRKIRCS